MLARVGHWTRINREEYVKGGISMDKIPDSIETKNIKISFEKLRSDISENIKVAAEKIREYSHSQVDIWRQIPNLALQTDGDNGYYPYKQFVYSNGLVDISPDSRGSIILVVDCENGSILSLSCIDRVKYIADSFASDEEIMDAWISHQSAFDAQYQLDTLRQAAELPHSPHSPRSEKEVQTWRSDVGKSLGLTAVYSRNQKSEKTE